MSLALFSKFLMIWEMKKRCFVDGFYLKFSKFHQQTRLIRFFFEQNWRQNSNVIYKAEC